MSPPPPTGRELEILKIVWQRGKATVREIYDALRPQDGSLAYTTVLSLLQVMEQKGLVGHEQAGKAYRYFALVERGGTLKNLAGGFLEQVFDGAMGEYVARALESRKSTVAELEELERMIAEAKRQVGSKVQSPRSKVGRGKRA